MSEVFAGRGPEGAIADNVRSVAQLVYALVDDAAVFSWWVPPKGCRTKKQRESHAEFLAPLFAGANDEFARLQQQEKASPAVWDLFSTAHVELCRVRGRLMVAKIGSTLADSFHRAVFRDIQDMIMGFAGGVADEAVDALMDGKVLDTKLWKYLILDNPRTSQLAKHAVVFIRKTQKIHALLDMEKSQALRLCNSSMPMAKDALVITPVSKLTSLICPKCGCDQGVKRNGSFEKGGTRVQYYECPAETCGHKWTRSKRAT